MIVVIELSNYLTNTKKIRWSWEITVSIRIKEISIKDADGTTYGSRIGALKGARRWIKHLSMPIDNLHVQKGKSYR